MWNTTRIHLYLPTHRGKNAHRNVKHGQLLHATPSLPRVWVPLVLEPDAQTHGYHRVEKASNHDANKSQGQSASFTFAAVSFLSFFLFVLSGAADLSAFLAGASWIIESPLALAQSQHGSTMLNS